MEKLLQPAASAFSHPPSLEAFGASRRACRESEEGSVLPYLRVRPL